MSRRLSTVLNGLLWAMAANFLAIAGAALLLVLSGTAPIGRWGGALRVLRGAESAVPAEELSGLKKAAEELGRFKRLPACAELLESWRRLSGERRNLMARVSQERARLEVIAAGLQGERDRIEETASAWKRDSEASRQARARRAREIRRAASEKVQRLYRFMSPECVARDLRARVEEGRAEVAAAVIAALPERLAAEVLEAFGDPAGRNKLYDLLARLPSPGAETGGAPGTGGGP